MKKLLTFAVCLTMSALLQSQTTIFVKPDGTGDGTSWATACSLETAVGAMHASPLSGTEIWVQSGTYYPTKMLVIPSSVKVYGGFAGTETNLSQRNVVANPTIIDGQHKIGSIFRLENSTEINGFTIQNGNANGNPQKNGGGVWADENCVIANCIITNNAATLNGGGVYANGKVEIINSTVENNTAMGNGKNTFGNCLTIRTDQKSAPATMSYCNHNIPDLGTANFRTSTVWTITDGTIYQEWSDVVLATGCDKNWYSGGSTGNFNSDCRSSSDRSAYGDFFSWCAVARFGNVLCPVPWRVPTKDDFRELNLALGGTDIAPSVNSYTSTVVRDKLTQTSGTAGQFWGGRYNANCYTSGAIEPVNVDHFAFYWAQTPSTAGCAYVFCYNSLGTIYPQHSGHAYHWGFSLRCIRDQQ